MSKQLEIEHTNVFSNNFESINNKNIRFIINQGGSRSSKTYSLCQLMIVYALSNPNKIISIIRKTLPTLKGTAMRDFFEIMESLNIYNKKNHNKSDNIYRFGNGSMIEFFGADSSQKLRGRKRDILWINESNEFNFDEFTQLNMRTTDKLIFDFNPSENFHWLYDLIERDNSILIKSTYKDNPFLRYEQILEIEELIKYDESYYRVYALGEKGTGKTTIYTHWKYFDGEKQYKERVYGLDFGSTHPTALVECLFNDNDDVFVKEIIYQAGLTSNDLIKLMKDNNISKSDNIICDYARPEIMEDLRRNGYNVKNAIKDVRDGINSVKCIGLYINKYSTNIIKEIGSYKWKTNGDIILEEPVKIYDDAMDAMRYAIHWYSQRNKKARKEIFRIYH